MKVITRRPDGSVRVQTINNEPDMCQQQYKDQCDINKIWEKYEKTGVITHLARSQGRYADLGDPKDLAEAIQLQEKAQAAFDTLPAEVRAAANHDKVNFLKMLKDPKYDDLLFDYGVKDPKFRKIQNDKKEQQVPEKPKP